MLKKMNRKNLTFTLTITFLLFFGSPSIAVINEYQDAVDAYNRKDYKTSYQLMIPLADKGFAQAQYNLGVMYEKGNGVKQNHRKAKKWFSLAADQDHAKAVEKLNSLSKKKVINKSEDNPKGLIDNSFNLNAENFQDGLHPLNKDEYKTTYQLLLQLAEQGIAKDQYNLGLMYGKGKGVVKDYSKAIKWWTLAAEQGDGKAQTNLGWVYERGKGVPIDTQKAAKLYQLASNQGIAKAQEKLDLLLNKKKGDLQENTVSSNDIPAGSDTSSTFSQGDAFDGARYSEETSPGVRDYINDSDRFHTALNTFNEKEFETAYQLFFELAGKGVAEAQINLGMMFENGQGVSQDFKEAVRWYRLAADQGLTKAQYNLGLMYAQGKGVDKDPIQAIKWNRLAADQGLIQAQTTLASMYHEGEGV